MAARWATFDCYGTLVDWNAGIEAELGRLFGPSVSGQLLARYHVIEPRVQRERPDVELPGRDGGRARRARGRVRGRRFPPESGTRWAARFPAGRCSPRCRARWPRPTSAGWQLVALSNTDRDLIEASLQAIGVPFDGRSWRPRSARTSRRTGTGVRSTDLTGADPSRHVHVAQSHFHDIVPAHDLGIRSIWINRLAERAEPAPTRELPDLTGLADVLDELVPLAEPWPRCGSAHAASRRRGAHPAKPGRQDPYPGGGSHPQQPWRQNVLRD